MTEIWFPSHFDSATKGTFKIEEKFTDVEGIDDLNEPRFVKHLISLEFHIQRELVLRNDIKIQL